MEAMYLASSDLRTVSKQLRWAMFAICEGQSWPEALWIAPRGETGVELYFRLTPSLYRRLRETLTKFDDDLWDKPEFQETLAMAMDHAAPVFEFAERNFPDWRICNTPWTAPAPERSKRLVEALCRFEWPSGRLDALGLAYARQGAIPGPAELAAGQDPEAVAPTNHTGPSLGSAGRDVAAEDLSWSDQSEHSEEVPW